MIVPGVVALAVAALAGCSEPGRTGPAAGAGPTAATPTTAMAPAQYVRQAAGSDQFEIQSSQLALTRSQNPEVRAFAQQMIADHSASTNALMQTPEAQAAGLPPLDPEHAQMLAQLQRLSGPQFDSAYMQMQVQAHREALSLQDSYARAGGNPGLRGLAAQTTPMIQHHLAEAQSVANQVAAVPATQAPMVDPRDTPVR
jgi:putative membrane protein